MSFIKNIFLMMIAIFITTSCTNDESINDNTILADYLATKSNTPDDVIACAASSKDEETLFVYFFPETNTTNFRLYLLPDSTHLKTDFKSYELQSESSVIAVANTIRAFELENTQEEVWAIVSFEKENQISYSNPINLKHKKSSTIYNSEITIDTSVLAFVWSNTLGVDNTENAIYFEIISDENNDLISGTYTYENQYTYLDNSNVVLTITPNNTQELNSDIYYGFAVMGVSKDNWVNFIAEKRFTIQK